MNNTNNTLLDKVISKLISGRFWMAILFSLTACCGFIMGKLTVEAFMTLAGVVVTGYFSRNRPDEKNGAKP